MLRIEKHRTAVVMSMVTTTRTPATTPTTMFITAPENSVTAVAREKGREEIERERRGNEAGACMAGGGGTCASLLHR